MRNYLSSCKYCIVTTLALVRISIQLLKLGLDINKAASITPPVTPVVE